MGIDYRLTHADENRAELGFISDFMKYDAQASIDTTARIEDNSFALTMDEDAWEKRPILENHLVYIAGTEWGGPVLRVKHSTKSETVTVSGLIWRGLLMRKIITPPAGFAYKTLSNVDANAALLELIGPTMGTLFQVTEQSLGVNVSGEWRFIVLMHAMHTLLSRYGLALRLYYDPIARAAKASAEHITDHSETIDLSQDYGVDLISTIGRLDDYNHVIALGAGELLDRDIRHAYRLDDGTITTIAPSGTWEDRATIYEYTNAETPEILLDGAKKRLTEYNPTKTVEMDPSQAGLDFALGDIVGARDRLTGMAAKATIAQKILTINDYGVEIQTKVG